MPKIKINGKELEVDEGKTVLQAALSNGIYIPHFCYHPHLSKSGNCRMCLVDIKPGPPKLSPACTTVVADNMEIDTENEKVAEARRAVMEFLLKNHPVDCPICDQAGECQLQDYYMAYDLKPARIPGPEDKVKKHKAIKMGKTLVLDTERCVLCTRCIRFMREVAGDDCLTIIHRRDRCEISAFPGREIDNPYSLCLADVCPVGAWTGADFRFKQRAWFLESSPSICPMCARGCNIWIDHRGGEVFRIRPRLNEEINKSFLCDQGRLSYHAINDDRLREPLIRKMGEQVPASWDEAIEKAAEIIKEAGDNLAVVVSASLSCEEGKAALDLFREKLGAKVYVHAGDPGWEDEILHRADENANTRGLAELEIQDRVDSVSESATIVLIESLCPHPLPDSVPKPAVVISPTQSPGAEAAEVAMPAASYAESAGTVVNFEGVKQSYEPAISLKGQALVLCETISRLASEIGKKLVA